MLCDFESGDKKQYGLLLVLFVPSLFSKPGYHAMRKPRHAGGENLWRYSGQQPPPRSRRQPCQTPVTEHVTGSGPQVTPAFPSSEMRLSTLRSKAMLSLMYPFQSPDPKNLETAVVLHGFGLVTVTCSNSSCNPPYEGTR